MPCPCSILTLFSIVFKVLLYLHVQGTVTLPVCLDVNANLLQVSFYVTSTFALPCDGLLGLESLVTHNINIFFMTKHSTRQWRVRPLCSALFLLIATRRQFDLLLTVLHCHVRGIETFRLPKQVLLDRRRWKAVNRSDLCRPVTCTRGRCPSWFMRIVSA